MEAIDSYRAANIANKTEAEAGTEINKFMTPERTAQAIAILSPAPVIASELQASEGMSNSVFMTPLRTSDAIESDKENSVFQITLSSTGWDGSEAPYTQTVAAIGIKETDYPFADINLENVLYEDIPDIMAA